MSRFDASGGKMYVPRERYSFTMSFCVVPASSPYGDALLVGEREVHAEQPHRGRVDRHRRVHLVERDAVEQRAHLAEVRDRHADLADLAAGERVVGVVAGLGRAGRTRPRGRSGPWRGSSRYSSLDARADEWPEYVRITQGRSRSSRHHSPACGDGRRADRRLLPVVVEARRRSCGRGARRHHAAQQRRRRVVRVA